MISMYLPASPSGAVPFRRYRFDSTGREAMFDKETGIIRALSEEEAAELEREGWKRKADKVIDAGDLRKVFETEAARHTGRVISMLPRATSDRELREQAHIAVLRHFGKPSR
jgi:hypothetical protein